MKKYKVLESFIQAGKRYLVGEIFSSRNSSLVESLLDQKLIEEATESPAAAPEGDKK
jgi:hypothetical protein